MEKIKVLLVDDDLDFGNTAVLLLNPHCSHPSCNSLISNIRIF